MKRSVGIRCGLQAFRWMVLFCVPLMLFAACEHRPLEELNNTHYIRVYIDEEIRNVTYGFYNPDHIHPMLELPAMLRVVLADPASGRVVAEKYLQNVGRDERGYYLDGYLIAQPGDYRLLVYNAGTETTRIREVGNYGLMEAYTNQIANNLYAALPSVRGGSRGDRNIVYEPDHLFVASDEAVHIGYANHIDTLRRSSGQPYWAVSMVKSYYLQVRIKGIEYVGGAVSMLTGMAGSAYLSTREMNPDSKAEIYFDMIYARRNTRSGEDVIYATFNTFGKLPEEQTIYELTFELTTHDGRTQTEIIDITDLFETEQVRVNQWIIIEKEIVVEPPPTPEGDGGFTPSVKDWGQEEFDIVI